MSHRTRYQIAALFFLTSIMSACIYGFKGGGLPDHIKTIAVVPFDNETAVTDVQREISDSLRSKLARRLGLRDAPENRANAVVRGTIRHYQTDIPVGVNAGTQAPTTSRRTVSITLDVEVTDQVNGKSLWSRKSFTVEGQYDEGAELQGRSQAIDRIVNTIVEGVQSQW
jgi:hypothetical protein